MRPRQFAHLDGLDAYEILGVDAAASRAQIDSARRSLVKVLHPDLPTGDANRMSLVNSAADILLDEAQRRVYDDYRDSQRHRRTAPRHESTSRPAAGKGLRSKWRWVWGAPTAPARRPAKAAGAATDPRRDRDIWRDRDSSGGRRASREADTFDGAPRTTESHPVGAHADGPRVAETRDTRPRSPGTRPPATRSADRPAGPGGAPTAGAAKSAPRSAVSRPDGPRADASRPGVRRSTTPRQRDDDWFSDEVPGTPRPPLKWQPPPPGRISRWRAKRRDNQRIARGQQVGRSEGPMIVILLLATLVLICAVGGALIGFSTQFGGGSTPPPSPSPHRSVPRKPVQKPSQKATPHKSASPHS
jgi:hypothetical protein